jgi:hypothetical protein
MKMLRLAVVFSLAFTVTLPSWAISVSGFESVKHPLGDEFYVSRDNSEVTVLVKREASSDMVDLTKASKAEQEKFVEITSTIRSEVSKSIGLTDWQIQNHSITPHSKGHIFEFTGFFTDFKGQKVEFLERQYRTKSGYVKIYAKKPQSAKWPVAFKDLASGLEVWSQ